MAVHILGSITFNAQRDYGGVIGTYPAFLPYALDFSINDVTKNITAAINTGTALAPVDISTLPAQIYLFEGSTSYASITDKGFKQCEGTTLKTYLRKIQDPSSDGSGTIFQTIDHPFWNPISQANHFECAGNVCDLEFAGDPLITKATGQLLSDGSVIVNANSSATPILYAIGSLGEPEVNLSYQSSNVFSSLFPGEYTIFLRDAQNCKREKNIVIGFQGLLYSNIRYFGEFLDNKNQRYRIEIEEKVNSGLSDELCWGDESTPVSISMDEDENIFKRVKGSWATIELVSKTHFEYLDVFNKPDKFYRAKFYKDPNGADTLLFTGYLVTEQYAEVFKDPPYISNLVFSDGLGELGSVDFKTNDEDITGVDSDFNTLLTVLRKLNIDANVRISVNLEINGVTLGVNDTPLHKTFNDVEVYKDKSCESVLNDLMTFYNSRILVENGIYYIIRVSENVRPFDYKEFDLNGSFVGSGTENNYFIIERPEGDFDKNYYVKVFPELRQKSAFKSIEITRPSHARPNVLDNGDFETILNKGTISQNLPGWTPFTDIAASTTLQVLNKIEGSGSNNYIKLEGTSASSKVFSREYNIAHYKGDTFNFRFRYNIGVAKGVPFAKIKWRVTWGNLYLNSAGKWNTFTGLGPTTVNTIYESSHQTWQSFEISSESIDTFGIGIQGNLKVEIFTPDFEIDGTISSFDPNDTTGFKEEDQVIIDTEDPVPNIPYLIRRVRFYKNDGDKWRDLGEEWEGRMGIVNTVEFNGLDLPIWQDPYMYLDDVFFEVFPNGEPLKVETSTKMENDDYFNEYSEDFISGTLPRDFDPLPGAPHRGEQDRFLYDYWKRDESGDPLYRYRIIGGNYLQMEDLITEEIKEMYKDNYWILTGEIFSKSKMNFINAVVDLINPTTDLGGGDIQGKVYMIAGLTWDVKKCLHKFTLHEVTETVVNGGVVTPPSKLEFDAFTTGFTTGFES